MSNKYFKFINAQATPQDLYVVEIVTLEFAVLTGRDAAGNPVFSSMRVPYLRKRTKEGGFFWGPTSTGVQYHDKKNYLHHRFSDTFFSEDIETFLNERSWESRTNPNLAPSALTPPPQQAKPQFQEEPLPF